MDPYSHKISKIKSTIDEIREDIEVMKIVFDFKINFIHNLEK